VATACTQGERATREAPGVVRDDQLEAREGQAGRWGVAKLLAKELTDLSFEGTPINGELIAQLATGAFLDQNANLASAQPLA
jgi:23S rRNA G2069 N7-methylase RlmK/C1962 C5-methylase RlmI